MSKGLKSLGNVKEMMQPLCVTTTLKKLRGFLPLEENMAHMGALGFQSQNFPENVLSSGLFFNGLNTEARCGK